MSIEIEQYLIDDYDVAHCQYLVDESSIEEWVKDVCREWLECGQGYSTPEVVQIVATQDGKFYEVTVVADIGSSKQDCGDRLYWVESIASVTHKEIPKPEPKPRYLYKFSASLTSKQYGKVTRLFKALGVELSIS